MGTRPYETFGYSQSELASVSLFCLFLRFLSWMEIVDLLLSLLPAQEFSRLAPKALVKQRVIND